LASAGAAVNGLPEAARACYKIPMPTNEPFSRVLIDAQLREAGWSLTDGKSVRFEYPLTDGTRADYLLADRNGRGLAVVEAKRASINPVEAEGQALAYAEQAKVPFIFLANGLDVWFWEPAREAQGGQGEVLHLCAQAEDIAAAGLSFVFSEGHAEMAISKFFTDLGDLDKIDRRIMQATYWNDTPADGDRKRRRQAEFLVQQFVPWTSIAAIGVMNQGAADLAREALRAATHRPAVLLQPGWYY
jgi:type I site-specific restriction endonuclease